MTNTSKLHIPRVSYTKDITNSKAHRLRRLNTSNSGTSSEAAAFVARAHLIHSNSYNHHSSSIQHNYPHHHPHHGQNLASAVVAAATALSPWNSFINPALLARYGHSVYQTGTSNTNSTSRHLNSSFQNYVVIFKEI